jgi:hypothetical protein
MAIYILVGQQIMESFILELFLHVEKICFRNILAPCTFLLVEVQLNN